jgi:hypothetical protein
MTKKPGHRLRPALDRLDSRDLPAALTASWAAVLPPTPAVEVRAALTKDVDVGAGVAAFAAARLGQRVGGGECAHLAAEAVRAAGGRFLVFGAGSANYDWGTLVTRVTGKSAGAVFSSAAAARPGDIVQYANARFRDGTRAAHHTAVVAAVDGAGRVTAVYQQNSGGVRAVTQRPLDLADLTAGRVRVYRPEARAAKPGVFRFTVVNDAESGVGVTERAGGMSWAYRLGRADTAGSYQTRWWITTGGVHPTLKVGGQTVRVEDGAGYQVYRGADGALAIRRLTD